MPNELQAISGRGTTFYDAIMNVVLIGVDYSRINIGIFIYIPFCIKGALKNILILLQCGFYDAGRFTITSCDRLIKMEDLFSKLIRQAQTGFKAIIFIYPRRGASVKFWFFDFCTIPCRIKQVGIDF